MRALSAGSTNRRPAPNTYAASSRTLSELAAVLAGGAADPLRPHNSQPAAPPTELLDDENDEFCYVCGLGVSRGGRSACA
jgi:hypothetical protein